MHILGLFGFILLASGVTATDNECPALYLRYSDHHTFCQPKNAKCSVISSVVSPEDRGVIMQVHNNYRSKLATGQEKNLPAASNMLQMVWDDELAAVAQKHANQCKFEHDCSDCRRVQSYGVGQNLAIEYTNSPQAPVPDWPSAIKSWYDEVAFFPRKTLDKFVRPPNNDETYGHFSQIAWAETWRVGCGYVLYKEKDMFKKLYVCNYGPSGNIVDKSMYKAGKAQCDACPVNSCCDQTCGTNAEYPGLCKINDGRAPVYEPQGVYFFYCDFREQSDCQRYAVGLDRWLVYSTLSGNYAGIVLKGGEESTIVFNNRLKPRSSSFCFVINYRKGPNVDGQEESNEAIVTFTITGNNFEVKQNLPSFSKPFRHQFSQFSMSLGWKMETELKLRFSVPDGKPEQFLEIEKIYATDGSCADNKGRK